MPKASKGTSRKHKESAKKERAEQATAEGLSAAVTTASVSVASTSAASTSATGASASNGPSQWRASRLKVTDTITKTDLKNQYRLKDEDLTGIRYRTERTKVGGIERTTFIYREQDIERRAWEKHGGPEKFDEYIARLKETYTRRYGLHAHFKQPRTYEEQGPQVPSSHISSSSGPVELCAGGSPALVRVKEQMVPWLWTAYNEALSWVETRHHERVG